MKKMMRVEMIRLDDDEDEDGERRKEEDNERKDNNDSIEIRRAQVWFDFMDGFAG